MQILLLFSLLAIAPATADKAQCDAKPFTLKKPVAQPAPQPPKPVERKLEIAQAAPPRATASHKPKITVGCKQTPAK